LNRAEQGDHYHIGLIAGFVRFFKWPWLNYWLVFPFAMAGLTVGALRNKRIRILAVVYLLWGLTTVVYFTNTRYRLPLMVLLIPAAVWGATQAVESLRQRNTSALVCWAAALAIFFGVEFWPVPGAGDLTAYYNTHAIILDAHNRRQEAMVYWQHSVDLAGAYSVFADISLARRYGKAGEIGKAMQYLDKIPDTSFAAASKYELLGDLMTRQGLPGRAAAAYERSLKINSGDLGTRKKLIRIYQTLNPSAAARQRVILADISWYYQQRD
jgi:hypothetical protein